MNSCKFNTDGFQSSGNPPLGRVAHGERPGMQCLTCASGFHLPLAMAAIVCSMFCWLASAEGEEPTELLQRYCFDCHEGANGEGGFDFVGSLSKEDFDGTLIFENLITAKMPPADADQPTAAEKHVILKWLAKMQPATKPNSYRRISRH